MTEENYPEMAETEWDDEGVSIDGSSPISVVSIAAWGEHNQPVASIQSAGCAYCNRWAVDFYVGANRVSEGPFFNRVDRRMTLTLIYFCDRDICREAASNELLETYGSAVNALMLELPEKIQERREMQAKEDWINRSR